MYTLKVLNDAEFDRLPYKHVKESLGCADPKTKTAYVRHTGIRPLDSFVTEHELDELVAKVSPHEEDGIRYKKGREIIAPIGTALLAMIPGIGPPLAAAAQAGYTGYKVHKGEAEPWQIPLNAALAFGGGKLAQGTSGYTNAVADSAKMGGGMVGQTLSGIQGMLGFTPGASAALAGKTATEAAMNPLIGMAASGLGSGASPAAALMGSTAAPGAAVGAGGGAGANILPTAAMAGKTATEAATLASMGFTPGAGSMTANVGANPSGVLGLQGINAAQNEIVKKKTLGQSLMEGWQNPGSIVRTAAGAAIPLIGSAFSKGNGTIAGEAGGNQTGQFNANDSELFNDVVNRVKSGNTLQLTDSQRQAITSNYDTELNDARDNLMQRWKMARPGSDITNDSQLQQAMADLESDFAEKKANAITTAELGLTQDQTQMLSELAAMDIYTLARNAQISVEEAKQFQDMLAQMGLIVAGQPQPSYSNLLQGG